jgi:4-hydroxy-tetrahydrodipicolinate synthase
MDYRKAWILYYGEYAMSIKGLYTALITPFTKDGAVDEKALARLVRYQIKGGIDGLLIFGTTGETPTLEPEEKERILDIVFEEAQGKIALMVGVGTNSTKTTIAQARAAEKRGASSLLVICPYYNKPTQEGIFAHFKATTEACSLPICVYNIPGRTCVNMETATLERLMEIPNIQAVKEASGNILQIDDVIEKAAKKKADFSILCGDDRLALPTIVLGAHGLTSVISNLLPRLTRSLVQAATSDLPSARKFHFTLKPYILAAFLETSPSPIKRMMELAGMISGNPRLPLVRPTAPVDAKLTELIRSSALVQEEVSHF